MNRPLRVGQRLAVGGRRSALVFLAGSISLVPGAHGPDDVGGRGRLGIAAAAELEERHRRAGQTGGRRRGVGGLCLRPGVYLSAGALEAVMATTTCEGEVVVDVPWDRPWMTAQFKYVR